MLYITKPIQNWKFSFMRSFMYNIVSFNNTEDLTASSERLCATFHNVIQCRIPN